MGSAIIFTAFAALALLVPLLLAGLLVKLTKTERPVGYWRNYILLAIGTLIVAVVIYHSASQIISGEIYLKPINARTALIASRENEPAKFALISVLYIALCGLLTISLFKMHCQIKKHLEKGSN